MSVVSRVIGYCPDQRKERRGGEQLQDEEGHIIKQCKGIAALRQETRQKVRGATGKDCNPFLAEMRARRTARTGRARTRSKKVDREDLTQGMSSDYFLWESTEYNERCYKYSNGRAMTCLRSSQKFAHSGSGACHSHEVLLERSNDPEIFYVTVVSGEGGEQRRRLERMSE